MDCSPPGSSVHGVLQARILKWVAMPSSRRSSRLGIEPTSPVAPALQEYSLLLSHWGRPQNFSGIFLIFKMKSYSWVFHWTSSKVIQSPQIIFCHKVLTVTLYSTIKELCLSVSCGDTGQQWTTAGTGPLSIWVWHKPSWRRSPLTPS